METLDAMKRAVCACAVAAAGILPAGAETSFTIYPNSAVLGTTVTFVDYRSLEAKATAYPVNFFNNSSNALGHSAAYSNIFGYPGGLPVSGTIEFGLTTGAGVYRADKFFEDVNRKNPDVPGVGVNAALHAGTGIDSDSDIVFKLMIDPGIPLYPVDTSRTSERRTYSYEWSRMDLVTTGVKMRTFLYDGEGRVSGLAAFNGITAGAAVDYMHLKVTGRGSYFDRRNIDFNVSDLGAGSKEVSVPVETTVNGSAAAGWDVLSFSPEIMVHANLLYVMNIYTGPSVSLNAGKVYVSSRTTGSMISQSAITDASGTITLVQAGAEVASAEMVVRKYITVPPVIPRWIAGIEFDFSRVKIQIEAADVLTKPATSFTAQFGVRSEF